MDDRWNEIPMPTEAEKNAAVARILDAGLPARPGLRHTLTETLQAVGLRTLFFGEADCLFLSVLFLLLCLLPAAAAAARQGPVGPVLFLLSPALYAALHLLTAWKETQSGTLEWRQACRISLRTMTALRMLVFGTVPLLWARAARWLNEVPTVLFCLLSIAALALYVSELRRFCQRRAEGGTIYALG